MATETTRMSVSEAVALLMEEESDPEKIAASLMQPFVPDMYLDELDVSGDGGFSRLLEYLETRFGRTSLEKDEICRFVERNRAALTRRVFPAVEAALAGVGAQEPDDGPIYVTHFSDQVRHAMSGRPDNIDVKSDRLFWLLFTLGHMIAGGKYRHMEAVRLLSQPDHIDRMSEFTLVFMLEEFRDAVNTSNQQPVELVMLLLECALLSRRLKPVRFAYRILTRFTPAVDSRAWVDVIERAFKYLQQHDHVQPSSASCIRPEDQEFMRRLASRFGEKVREDDF